ncbi:MAG: alanine racemase [Rhodospirillaceae bacterium]|nr:alanine racemase [Rhodospirillaceae bacterium]|tara:strand:- start:3813 stop:4937 length:1125 start_codon:yes stop_codon:yes gene_type:complete
MIDIKKVPKTANSLLLVHLGRIVRNYRYLTKKLAPAECSATLKANAYGLGAVKVGQALKKAGCSTFFLATIDEAIELREAIRNQKTKIAVLNGVPRNTEHIFHRYNLIPVLNDLDQLNRWHDSNLKKNIRYPSTLHVDTGMNRLGLSLRDYKSAIESPTVLHGAHICLIMSHLACSDEPDHENNTQQLEQFKALSKLLPNIKLSLANSGGIFLGTDFHFDMARPGIALYGSLPGHEEINPLRHSVDLYGRILQVRQAEAGSAVGYGGTHKLKKNSRIAVVGTGYADGYQRSFSSASYVFFEGFRLPVIGRVSMDTITVNISDVPESTITPGDFVEIIGDKFTVDDAAVVAGTVPHELFTGLGKRHSRIYGCATS